MTLLDRILAELRPSKDAIPCGNCGAAAPIASVRVYRGEVRLYYDCPVCKWSTMSREVK